MDEVKKESRQRLVIIDPAYAFSRPIEEELLRRSAAAEAAVHLITEPAFQENFFRVPQSIDVLVVDREHYGTFLEEHDISTIFVLVPEVEVGTVYPGNVRTLMKYLPAKEIVAEIDAVLRTDADNPQAQAVPDRNTKVIAVCSPVGGSGKSLTAYALARKLRKLDQTVLLVGCDATQSISVFLPREEYAEKKLADELREPGPETYWTVLQNVERDEVDYLRPFEQDLLAVNIGMAQWASLIGILKEKQDFDYLVLDLGSTAAADIQAVFDQTDVMVLVTEENEVASRKLARLQSSPDQLPKCECVLVANEYRSDGLRLAPETIFGTILPYQHWSEALEDPVFYRIALKVTE